jgi:hypothetical protein
MKRSSLFAVLFLLPVLPLRAADWTDAAFPVKSHDFGAVAVAAKTEFTFPIVNRTSGTIHIQSVRASCGCTTPFVDTEYVAPNETGSIRARFNTDTFRGKRGATLTVVIDKPYYSEVRLRVDGYIRSDMVFHPGSLEFTKLTQGESETKSSSVMYAGRNDWEVVDVRSNLPWLIPTVKETGRGNGKVNYEISVTVREDAPTGFFQDEVLVFTNDRSMPRVPLRVSGEVASELSISPQAIALGSIKPGQALTQKMVVLGKEPFVIESIEAEGWQIEFAPTTEAKKTHVVVPTFTPLADATGPIKSTIVITTSGEQSVTAKALLTADVRDR